MTGANSRNDVLYLEDLYPGLTFTTGTHALDTGQIKAFARQFDPQPFHLDEEAAKHSVLGVFCASGWHTVAITMRLITTIEPIFGNGVIGAGAEVNWPRPTLPGDVLHVVMKILEIAPSRSRPDRGIATVCCETFNQRGEVVQILKPKLVVLRRNSAS